ncbi:hypothetical protein JCGZ_11679 [Jatropha curcas]|uniref:Uncharacterized protein n=1 Tax=Jatropha curcas TaxID=180498 RepID=A0A067K8H7_JATCU|nr:uncharacterized protein LOC105640583 [Jatropha curcas]XP_012080329.1 uncharacterized protein LOC105640583 [Jatropha curcas]KDP31303.1 hypothetical protein JCGZ_11679 [Jatropha curcas]
MATIGMQAEMQCHYFPGFCSNRDLNLNASYSIWPSNTVDKILKNGQYCNVSLAPSSPDQYLTCKEKLKQTILQHEAIFKDQIHELHRLYKRQKELMDEVKRIRFHGHQLQVDTAQSNQIFCGPSFEYFQKKTVSAIPWLNPTSTQFSVVGAENHSHLKYVEGKLKEVGCITVQTEGYGKESELLESKCKKFGNKILDLELPADEYIDSEQEESLAGETVPPDVPGYHMKSIADDVQKSEVEPSRGIDDGNLVFQDGDTRPASFSRKTNCLADLNEPIKLEEETNLESNVFLGPVPCDRENTCQDLSGKRNSDLRVQLKQTIQGTQTREDPEIPEAFSNVLDLEKSKSMPECLSDNDEAGQSSSGMNSFPERICTETLSSSSEDDEIEQDHDISTSHLNLNRRMPKKKRKDFDLESYPVVKAACTATSSELIPLDDVMTCDSSWKKHTRDFVRAPIAVQALPCFNSAVRLKRRSKPKFSSTSDQSSFCNTDNEFASEGNGSKKRVKDFVDLKLKRDIDLNSISPNCSSDGEEKSKDSTGFSPLHGANPPHLAKSNKKLDLNCNSIPDSGEQLNAKDLVPENRHNKKSSGCGFHFDLNSWIQEDESSPMPAPLTEINLQAPASPENKESSPPRGESDENQLEMLCQLPGQENNLLEDLITVAAEAIVSISLSQVQGYKETEAFKPCAASQSDSLYWFAKIASNIVDDPENGFGIALSFKNITNDDEYLSYGMDYFEAMTLNLKETNVEEYYCKTNIQKEEAACPLPLPSQPRRGRRRQQRKDFQSEILPSLASLSRYEVTEDLQAIGGLIEAAHRSTCARKTGGNGWTRGRRRRPSISSSNAETSMCTLLKQRTRHGECSIEERSLIGWGKITRRRRGQRCPASKPRLILGQV